MSISKGLRQRVAWLALCAVFFAALAPSISHFLASATHGKIWVEICSLYGPKRMALDLGADKDKTPGHQASSMSHCPFCRLQNDLPVLPTLANLSTFALTFDEAIPESIASAPPRARFIRTAHLTRAPPSIS